MPHLLKSLELNGFKSFAQKTILEFPAGITAIVGPNGSGKSNVVDAIRWLLGEREAKNLRGGKVEDLIFAGTPEKPRQSLAQASLRFQNEGNFFPVDWSEISVTRQVSRDGESRYFLNQSEIRLKDLIDFFAKVRLGTKGLIVITQGNSDLFIRANPSERREMIEEMLGLREFQIKKLRAENQLKNTQINLDKVRALIEEILPHLRSLRRQTARWDKRDTLETELKNLENVLFGSEWRYLHQEMIKTDEELSRHKKELTELEISRAKAEKHQKEVEIGEPREREELKKIKLQVSDLLEKQIRLEKDLGRLEAQLEISSSQNLPSSLPSQKLVNLIREIRHHLELGLDKNIDEVKNLIQELLKKIDSELALPTGPSPKPNLEVKSQLEKINHDLGAVKKEILALREKEKQLEKSQGEFYQSFKSAVTAVEDSKRKIESWENSNQKIVFNKERLSLRLEELKRQIAQAGRHPKEIQELILGQALELNQGLESHELRELERQIFKIRGDLASIGEVDEALVKEAKETEERYQFLKRELEDAEKAKGNLRELIRDLNEKIKTEFNSALREINREFGNFFKLMFGGGHAKLNLKKADKKIVSESNGEEGKVENGGEAEDDTSEGIEIDLGLPRKRLTSLEVLSGGEKSLVGIAALFALISVSPPPFLVLDEIDAALDERNARRFAELLKSFSKQTQFVLVTHNRASMEVADVLYGVTLNNDGTSKILSLKLDSAS